MANDFPYNEDWHDYSEDLTSNKKNEKRVFFIDTTKLGELNMGEYLSKFFEKSTNLRLPDLPENKEE